MTHPGQLWCYLQFPPKRDGSKVSALVYQRHYTTLIYLTVFRLYKMLAMYEITLARQTSQLFYLKDNV